MPDITVSFTVDEVLRCADAEAIREKLGLGTAALSSADDFASADHTHAFSALTGRPTTLAGYGITDAAAATHSHPFADLTSKPTTLSGFGITDGATASQLATKQDALIFGDGLEFDGERTLSVGTINLGSGGNGGVTGTLPIARGGTGTTSPTLTAGSGISITGAWPNHTIAASGAADFLTLEHVMYGAVQLSGGESVINDERITSSSLAFVTPKQDIDMGTTVYRASCTSGALTINAMAGGSVISGDSSTVQYLIICVPVT